MNRTLTYLDYNATAPIRPAVIKAMAAAMERPLNPSSVHSFGRQAKRLVDEARQKITQSVNAEGYNVVFTSSGTEANNLALKDNGESRLFVSAVEHSSVLNVHPKAEKIAVNQNGIIDLGILESQLVMQRRPVVSIQLANNETGIIQPIAEIAQIVHNTGGMLHVDAVQGLGKMALDISKLNVDLFTLSAHKIGGPQGVGALLFKPGIEIHPQILGGGQELGLRAGTQNVAGIVGFGVAVEAVAELQSKFRYVEILRDRMEAEIKSLSPDTIVIGQGIDRLPNTSCMTMPCVKNETQLIHFDLQNIAVSAGAACSSGKVNVSHVLLAMGLSKDQAETAIRISLGTETSQADIDRFTTAWKELYTRTHALREAA
jgi:cysteine desulfurase